MSGIHHPIPQQELSVRQRLAAEIFVTEPKVSTKEIAERVGVCYHTVEKWKAMPHWQDYVKSMLTARWERASQKAQIIMEELADSGDFRAVQYILNSAGYAAPQQIEMKTTIKVTIDDNNE